MVSYLSEYECAGVLSCSPRGHGEPRAALTLATPTISHKTSALVHVLSGLLRMTNHGCRPSQRTRSRLHLSQARNVLLRAPADWGSVSMRGLAALRAASVVSMVFMVSMMSVVSMSVLRERRELGEELGWERERLGDFDSEEVRSRTGPWLATWWHMVARLEIESRLAGRLARQSLTNEIDVVSVAASVCARRR